jgi:hypothetical protein
MTILVLPRTNTNAPPEIEGWFVMVRELGGYKKVKKSMLH